MFNFGNFFPGRGVGASYNPNNNLAFFGMGAEREGFDRPQGLQAVSLASTGINRIVNRSFAPMEGGVVFAPHKVTPVALTGNGATLQGQMALQALSEFMKDAEA